MKTEGPERPLPGPTGRALTTAIFLPLMFSFPSLILPSNPALADWGDQGMVFAAETGIWSPTVATSVFHRQFFGLTVDR